MNTKNKTLAIVFDKSITAVSRNVNPLQLTLFGLGYQWNLTANTIQQTPINFPIARCVIYLNTETKTLSWEGRLDRDVKCAYAEIRLTAVNLLEVIDFVEHPPKAPVDDIHVVEVRGEDRVSFVINLKDKSLEVIAEDDLAGIGIQIPVSSETIIKVAKSMGILSNVLPVVRFCYPSSTTGKMRNRIVRVTFMNHEYIRGYELENTDAELGTFKAFQRKKVKENTVTILSFCSYK